MTKKILWFFEHFEREMPIINLCRERLEADGIDVEIQPSLLNFPELSIYGQSYHAIIVPSKNKLLAHILQKIDIPIICLNYEQMLSGINNVLKAPDALVKQARYLLAWSDHFGDYLKNNGIQSDSIIYSQRPQNEIASQYINSTSSHLPVFIQEAKKQFKNIIYLPLTCLQAFKTDAELWRLAKATCVDKSLLITRKYAVRRQIVSLYQEIETATESFFILRPHPGVTIEDHKSLLREIGLEEVSNLLITDEGNAYDWLNISDIVVSNYSSVLLDAQAVEKDTYLFKPDMLPQWMHYDWFDDFNVIHSFDEWTLEQAKKNTTRQKAYAYPTNSQAVTEILKQALQEKAAVLSKKRLFYLTYSPRFWADIFRLIKAQAGFGHLKVKKDYESFKKYIG